MRSTLAPATALALLACAPQPTIVAGPQPTIVAAPQPTTTVAVDSSSPAPPEPSTPRLPVCVPATASQPVAKTESATGSKAQLPPEVIQRIVREHFPRLRKCYERGLGQDPKLEGRVATRFTIGSDGALTCVGLDQSTNMRADVADCVVQSFSAIRFPPPESGTVTVVYPIMFSPGEEPDRVQLRCHTGDAKSCGLLGWMYKTGQGVAKDPVRSAELFRQGCNGGDAAACNSLGYAHALGAGAPLDGAKAMALFLQACEAKHANACDSVGEAHEKGWGTKVDPAEALKWYEKACSMGNAWSCDRLKELRRP
jgi:hypothetical protein